jgi:hypothetical protein
MRPGYCKTEEELNISKALFVAYIKSEVRPRTCLSVPYSYVLCFPTSPFGHVHLFLQVPELIGESHVTNILDFYKEANVEVHEPFYAFWLRKFIHHFDEYNNCSHEGTNGGMKRHAAFSCPLHSIQKSIDVQIQQASISCATNEQSTLDKHILWSDLPTEYRLNNRGESLVTEQWQLSTDW